MKKLLFFSLTGLLLCALLTGSALAEVAAEPTEPEILIESAEDAVPELEEFTLGGEDMPLEAYSAESPEPTEETYAVEAPLPFEPEWDGTAESAEEQAVMAAADDFTIEGTVLTRYNGNGGNVVIPNGVTEIGREAFYKYASIQSVTVPNGVTIIWDAAFSGCTGLQSVKLPNTLQKIGSGAFSGCSGLQSFTLPSKVVSLSKSTFSGCNGLKTFTISGEGLVSIGDYCFNDCTSLESINLPNSVTSIGAYAFENTKSLATINLNDNLISMGQYAFYSGGLVSIKIPGSLIKMKSGVFAECKNLTQVDIQEGIQTLGNRSFCYCTNLSNITIPSSVTTIEESCFQKCIGLKHVTILGNEHITIKEWAFSECDNLLSVSMPNRAASIGDLAFSATLTLTIEGHRTSTLSEITLGPDVTSIGRKAFLGTSLVSVKIPENLSVISNQTFEDCTKLKEVEISNSVTKISCAAFSGCSSLEYVEIPTSVTIIESEAFSNCTSMLYAIIPSSVTTIGKNAFYKNPSMVAYVDDNSYAYRYCEANGIPHRRIGEPLPHNHVRAVIPGYPATCSQTGLTDGFYCTICNEVLVAQKTIPVIAHTPAYVPALIPTCTENGHTDGAYCAVCGVVLQDCQPIPATGHSVAYVPALAPRYQVPGYTEGSYCWVCGMVFQACETIPALTVPEIALPNVKSNGTITLALGEQRQLIPSFAAANGWTVNGYQSGKPAVATVDGNGLVTATAEGKAKITVTTAEKKKATLTVQVVDPYKPAGIAIAQGKTVTIAVGQPIQLTAVLSPETAQATLTWTSSKSGVAAVDANGLVTPLAEGKAKITVQTHNKKKAKLTVQVVDPYKPASVAIAEGKAVTVSVGQPIQLTAVLSPETAQATLTWTSSKPGIATVDANGLVTPLAEGKAKITVQTHNKKKAKLTVQVVDPYKPAGIAIAQGKAVTLRVGEVLQLNAGLTPATAQSALTWVSKKPAVAAVDANGVVTALAKGKTKITVTTYNKKKATVTVNVVE